MKILGFGCSRLTSNLTKKQASRNLEVAFENGIRHFDAARLYGFGLAEGMLGEFVRAKRSEITITTKFGLFPNSFVLKNLLLQNVLRSFFRVAKKLPILSAGQQLADRTIAKRFGAEDARTSLETSLRELGTDHIDHFLLHEANISEANNDKLIEFLETQKNGGKIGNYGIAGFSSVITKDFGRLSNKFTVLQTDSSYPASVPDEFLRDERKHFYFSPFLNLKRIEKMFHDESELAADVLGKLDFAPDTIALDLILHDQYHNNSEGILLFASSDDRKIRQSIRRWEHVGSLPAQPDGLAEVKTKIRDRLGNIKIG